MSIQVEGHFDMQLIGCIIAQTGKICNLFVANFSGRFFFSEQRFPLKLAGEG
jgi:hypothetical protein